MFKNFSCWPIPNCSTIQWNKLNHKNGNIRNQNCRITENTCVRSFGNNDKGQSSPNYQNLDRAKRIKRKDTKRNSADVYCYKGLFRERKWGNWHNNNRKYFLKGIKVIREDIAGYGCSRCHNDVKVIFCVGWGDTRSDDLLTIFQAMGFQFVRYHSIDLLRATPIPFKGNSYFHVGRN